MNDSIIFFNRCFDKKRLKDFILWFFTKYGEKETIHLIESLKNIGFQYATKAGVSIGIDDLIIPFIKSNYINVTEQKIRRTGINYQKGDITEIEQRQSFIDEWSLVSEKLKTNVIQFFKATDIFNPIYMMAFSGARGNISQVRQLVGMRGLMADPQGQILDFPIRSNFREGLTLTEYLVSCYGARKGVVDTALRTATSGYLTRRLVDATQQVIIGRQNCYTNRGIQFTDLKEGPKTLLSLKERITGRVLLEDVFMIDPLTKDKFKIGSKNQEIPPQLAARICATNSGALLRSPLTCHSKDCVCQLCYGWNLAYNTIVSIGEAVGVLAAQSIGEPGTQLTMRTFHTGGVFTGGLIDQIYAPFNGEVNYINNFKGVLIRTSKGRVGFLTKNEGNLQVKTRVPNDIGNSKDKTDMDNLFFSNQMRVGSINKSETQLLLQKILLVEKNLKAIRNRPLPSLIFKIPIHTILFIRNGGRVFEKELIAELPPISPLEDRSQEKEQEVLAPNTGQIFFDNLVLIEKVKREGSTQKVTYGLGSLWIVSAINLQLIIHPQIFPFQGDLISDSSMVQKLKILIEKYYHFDNILLNSTNNWKSFRSDIYSASYELEPHIKQFPRDKVILTRDFHSSNFQKIYYQNLHYFISISYPNNFLKSHLYSQTNSSSIHEKLIKNRQYKFSSKVLLVGLNFSCQNNIASTVKKQNFKSHSIFYILQSEKTQKTITRFFSVLLVRLPIDSKLKYPIFTRKISELQNQFSGSELYQYWIGNYYSPNISTGNLDIWIFSMKKSTVNSDSILLKKRSADFPFLSRQSFKTKKIKTRKELAKFIKLRISKVSKSFFFILNFEIESLNLSYKKTLEILDHYRWISAAQLKIILVNRQSFTNLQIPDFWYLSGHEGILYHPFQINPKTRGFKIDKFLDNLSYNPHFHLGDVYNINLIARPILINPSLFINIYNKKLYRHYYLVQSYLIGFYYAKLSNLKGNKFFFRSENKKIGFQTQIRLSSILNINLNLGEHKLKRMFLESGGITFSEENSILPNYYNIKQDYLSWPCLFIHITNRNFLEKIGYRLNPGEEFKREIYFDRQNILVDSINGEFFCKFRLLKFFSYRGFYALKIRFPVHPIIRKECIIFQKVEESVNKNTYYSRILSLNTTNKNREYHDSLTFNSLDYCPNNFTRRSFNPKNVLNFGGLYIDSNNFSHNIFSSIRGVFLRATFLQTLKVKNKTLVNSVGPVGLKSYSPLREGDSGIFRSDESTRQNKRFYFNFNHLIEIEFASKTFSLNSVKELDIQSLISQKVKNTDKVKLLYKSFKYFSNGESMYIELFSPYMEGEIVYKNIYKNSIIQKLEKDFVILNRSNLASFILSDYTTVPRLKVLMLGNFLRYGTKFEKQRVISKGGQVICIDKSSFTVQEATPFLITSNSLIHVHHEEIVDKGSRLFTFLSHRAKTGDIIQGIPKVEEFFEARLTRDGIPLVTNLHIQTKQLFQTYRSQLPISEATQKSFEKVQYLIIDEIQKIYCSQGVYIADKHLEIVVRQMTSKVQIIKGGQIGFLTGELVNFNWVTLIEQKFGNREVLYEPIILGITKSCLETDSFISAASFQETTRILSKAAIQHKIDFIRGLKQNVILGNLIPAGTGFFSPLYFKYSKVDSIKKSGIKS